MEAVQCVIIPHVEHVSKHPQDMLCDCLTYGLTRACGSLNVYLPFHRKLYSFNPHCTKHWPVHLGATAIPPGRHVSTAYNDLYFVDARFFTRAPVLNGLMSEQYYDEFLTYLCPERLVLINGSDNPNSWPDIPEPFNSPLLRVARPHPDAQHYQLHISPPLEHIWRHRALFTSELHPRHTFLYAALNDNHHYRRTIMETLANSNIPDMKLRWGSAEGYRIDRTLPPITPGQYYTELANTDAAVAYKGVGIDTLRHFEILATGALLIADTGFCDGFSPNTHYLPFSNTDELVKAVWWAIDHPEEAKRIAKRGHHRFLTRHTPEALATELLTHCAYTYHLKRGHDPRYKRNTKQPVPIPTFTTKKHEPHTSP